MLPTRPSTKASGDHTFIDNNQMVTYTDMDVSYYPTNSDPNGIPKIKVEDISYQNDCSTMQWQRNDCYQTNQFMANNNVYSSLDSRAQPNSYSEAMPTTTISPNYGHSNPVYNDLSNQYPTASNSYQMLYTSNSMVQQNGSVHGINEQNYNNISEVGESQANSSPMSCVTAINANANPNLNYTSLGESKTDCVQTVTPTAMSDLNESSNLQNIQFMKTIEFLRATDLLNLTLQTAELIKKNLEIQKEINNTKQLLSRFVTS